MTMYDAITGTIMQRTGIIPCLSTGYRTIKYRRIFVDKQTDKYVFFVLDGYKTMYRVVFKVFINTNGVIFGFEPIYAEVLR